mgnify:CR=1 FL=1
MCRYSSNYLSIKTDYNKNTYLSQGDSMMTLVLLACVASMVGLITIAAECRHHHRTAKEVGGPPVARDSGNTYRTSADPGKSQRCSICLGPLADCCHRCACGALFHADCLTGIETCPFCGRPTAAIISVDRTPWLCPGCGMPLDRHACRTCGALVPDACGIFPCPVCGTAVAREQPVCVGCGTCFVRGPAKAKGFMNHRL